MDLNPMLGFENKFTYTETLDFDIGASNRSRKN